jgi:hypothetical protein
MDRQTVSAREKRAGRRLRAAGVSKEGIGHRRKWQMENRARAIAYVIARAIKRRGLPAKNILGQARPLIIEKVLSDVDSIMVRGVA